MKTLLFLSAVLTLSLAFSPFARADADGPDCWKVRGVADDDSLNLRAKPSAQAKAVGTIPSHAVGLENLNESPEGDAAKPAHPGWCKVRYNTLKGWVNCKFLEAGDC